jgi:urease accessory protein UreH
LGYDARADLEVVGCCCCCHLHGGGGLMVGEVLGWDLEGMAVRGQG